jgi:hypothetical protein
MAYTPGPKQQQLRELREGKIKNAPKPTKADIRNSIAKIKPVTRNGGKRGR